MLTVYDEVGVLHTIGTMPERAKAIFLISP